MLKEAILSTIAIKRIMKKPFVMGFSPQRTITLLILIAVLQACPKVDCAEETCAHSSKEKCYREGCEWCDQRKGCYNKEQAKLLGPNCNRFSSRQLAQSIECGGIAYKDDCLASSHCRWCTSQHVDDACFKASEAWKLPPQVFACSKRP
eukprot:Gb_28064 [translate_table: standard]